MSPSMPSTRRAGILIALVTAAISGVAVFLNADAVRAFGDATATPPPRTSCPPWSSSPWSGPAPAPEPG